MRSKIKITRIGVSLLTFLAATGAEAAVPGVALQQLYPAKNTRFMSVESPSLSPAEEDLDYLGLGADYARYYRDFYRRMYFDLNVDYVTAPLVQVDSSTGTRSAKIVDSLGSANFSFGYQFLDRLGVFAEVSGHRTDLAGPAAPSYVVGDTRVLAKLLLNPPDDANRTFSIAIIPEVILPTGDQANFAGNGSVGVGAHLSAEKEFGKLTLSGNLGYRYAKNAVYRQVDYRNLMPFAVGALYRWNRRMGWTVEANGSQVYTSDDYQNHLELYTGPRWRIDRDWTALAGVGTGHFRSNMANDFRAIAQIKFAPFGGPRSAPEAAERPVVPVVDTDRDGVIDGVDRCPLTPLGTKVNSLGCALKEKVEITLDIAFGTNDATIHERYYGELDRAGALIAEHRDVAVEIEGHTDNVGKAAYNLKLSERRAQAIVAYLRDKFSISGERIRARGYGLTRPIADNRTEEGRTKNRRVIATIRTR